MTRFLVFIAVALALISGIHYYLWARLIRDTSLPSPWNTFATCALVVMGASMPVALILGRNVPRLGRVLVWPAFVWMGVMFLLLVAVAAVDVVRLAGWAYVRARGLGAIDPERRTFLARLAAALAASTAAGMAATALRSALSRVAVRRVEVRLSRLPAAYHGFRIVQLTDIHIGPTIGREFIEQIVRTTNELQPDVVAITGDLVDGSVSELCDAVAPLATLRARHGVFFVTGNHEYFSGVEEWIRELPRLGIRVLRNERVAIDGDGPGFDLAGVDDHSAARYGGADSVAALEQALAGREPARELILLAHQPRSFLDAVRFGVGLQLSGHTHGGQLWPFSYIVKLTQPFLAGLHRSGDAQIYVSRGTGYWGPPMRLGAPAEVTHLVLQSAAAGA